MTGETGAGKSIIIGALDILLGARASTDLIRKGRKVPISRRPLNPNDLSRLMNIWRKQV